jgi:hypothetical protein
MSLAPELRRLLMDGPHPKDKSLLRYGGPASVRAAWARHRQELIDSCKPGRRPWGLWLLQIGVKQRPTEAGELKLIRQLELYRDEKERAYVEQRLEELVRLQRTRRQPHRRVV